MTLPTDDEGRPTYRFNPKLLGGEVRVTLGHRALTWRTGMKGGELPYADIRFIKLAFQPANMQFSRYVCVVEGKNAPRLTISNGHRVSMTEFEARNDQYNAFVRGLHQKVAASGGKARFQGGETPLRYGVMLGLCCMLLVVIAIGGPSLWAEAMKQGNWRTIVLGFGCLAALALTPLGFWLWRNRPKRYDPQHLPADVLPVQTTRQNSS